MRSFTLATLPLLVLATFTSGNLFQRQGDTCSNLTSQCPIAQDFCYDYLNIGPARTTVRRTLTAVTVRTASTVMESTSACARSGPMKKRSEANDVPPAHLEEREKTPACLRPYTATASLLSSACSCYDYPITSSTRTVHVTKTLSDAPTTIIYTKTVTSTTLTSTPTCNVVVTDHKTGQDTRWELFYGICNAFRTGPTDPLYDYTFQDKTTPLCEALQKCANGTTRAGGKTFEVSWNDFANRPAGPRWDCNGYGAGPENVEFFNAHNWHESYGFRPVSE